MRFLLSISTFCFLFSAFGQPDWQLLNYYPGYTFADAPGGNFDFPDGSLHSHYPAFLVSTQAFCGDVSGKVVRCTFTVDCSGNTVFRYGGQGTWNNGSRPASARLFFSCLSGYDNNTTQPTNFWFNTPWVEISTNGATNTLTATLDHFGDWTDAGGPYSSANDDLVGGFWNTVSNVCQIGLAFGGGSFYDTGIAVTSGQATFRLLSFSVSWPASRSWLEISAAGMLTVHGDSNTSYTVERSADLVEWNYWATAIGEASCGVVPGFYRARR